MKSSKKLEWKNFKMNFSRRSRGSSSSKGVEDFNLGRDQDLTIIQGQGGSTGQEIEVWGLALREPALTEALGQEGIRATLADRENTEMSKHNQEARFLATCNLKGLRLGPLDLVKDLEATGMLERPLPASATRTDLVDLQTISLL